VQLYRCHGSNTPLANSSAAMVIAHWGVKAKRVAAINAPQPAMRSADEARDAMPVAGYAERPLPDARGKLAGRPEG
jgi:hypothetical protein